ncbi:MAG: GNAT family N-acetyltransferase [Acidimicrobiia bacterium]
MGAFAPMTDGVVTLRAPAAGDAARLVGGRDEESRRWLGDGSAAPAPTACIVVDDTVVGWVDNDSDQPWLGPDEVNLGYMLFPGARRHGYAIRSVALLLHHLALRTDVTTAMLLIDRDNERSLALAARAGFAPLGDRDRNTLFARPVPPLRYSDGVVTMRRPEPEDLDADLGAKDEEQIMWLWLPGQREQWERMSVDKQREHARQGLAHRITSFGTGPKWTFSVDAPPTRYVTYVDVDLANPDVPRGEANISYSTHPASRGQGFASRSVRLALRFITDHTGAREAHIVVDEDNAPSRRVAASVGARETDRFVNEQARTMVRYVVSIQRQPATP